MKLKEFNDYELVRLLRRVEDAESCKKYWITLCDYRMEEAKIEFNKAIIKKYGEQYTLDKCNWRLA
jgi:hypothetical protein